MTEDLGWTLFIEWQERQSGITFWTRQVSSQTLFDDAVDEVLAAVTQIDGMPPIHERSVPRLVQGVPTRKLMEVRIQPRKIPLYERQRSEAVPVS